jgi:hypothetical protein
MLFQSIDTTWLPVFAPVRSEAHLGTAWIEKEQIARSTIPPSKGLDSQRLTNILLLRMLWPAVRVTQL